MSADQSTASHATVEYRFLSWAPGRRFGSDGSAWSLWRRGGSRAWEIGSVWERLHPSIDVAGRPVISIRIDGKTRNFKVCRLVLEAFEGPCPPLHECCHNDGNPANNYRSNLRWGTKKMNMDDRRKHGRTSRGSKHSSAKLSEQSVIEIVRLREIEGLSYKELAARYEVSEGLIGHVLFNRAWSWLTKSA